MFKKIFVAVVAICAFYSFYLTFLPNYNYHMFNNELTETMKIVPPVETPKNVMKRIMRLVEEYDIPVAEEDIELELVNNSYVTRLSWEETVNYFPFYILYQKVFEYSIDTGK